MFWKAQGLPWLGLVAVATATSSLSSGAARTNPVEASFRRAAAVCKARGGVIRTVCLRAQPMCVLLYRDAGRPCTDSSQCLGRCLASGPTRRPFWPWEKPVVGACARDNDPCGCKTEIVRGRPQDDICTD